MGLQGETGRIVTFYSFKGGVGRTMALANVGFLAAMSGRRTLLLDFDLEAPGLPYYFRGLSSPSEAQAVKAAPGVLNLAWNWHSRVTAAGDEGELARIFEEHEGGRPFGDCVRDLVPQRLLPEGACLQVIGAGSDGIAGGVGYEAALAEMSWPAFFKDEAGGALISSLRSWAKSSFDFVLIDSRTGFADVAGICTMQMPDTVALCFVLNRQNIDGIAKVGSAIRREAGHVEVRAVPMRVARANTGEEADALARARAELIRVAKFRPEDVERDFEKLAINAALSVPFSERLAAFAVPDTSKDVLTLDYVSLARGLLGIDVAVPVIDRAWLEEVRQRLKPTRATLAFMSELGSAAPERAVEELDRLLDGALQLEMEGEDLEAAYLRALIDSALKFERENQLADPATSPSIAAKALNLARSLAASDPADWRGPLIELLERSHRTSAYGDPDEEIVQLEEIDGLLALEPETPGTLWRRSVYRRRLARLSLASGTTDAAIGFTHEAERLLGRLNASQAETRDPTVALAEADVLLIRGDGLVRASDPAAAAKAFEGALAKLAEPGDDDGTEAMRVRFDLHCRMARLLGRREPADLVAARDHAMHAVSAPPGNLLLSSYFADLVQTVCAQPEHPEFALRFIELAFPAAGRRGTFSVGRSGRAFTSLCDSALRLCEAVEGVTDEKARHDAIELVVAAVARANSGERKSGYRLLSSSSRKELSATLLKLAQVGAAASAGPETIAAILAAADQAAELPEPASGR